MDRTPHKPYSVVGTPLAAQSTYSDCSLCDSDLFCITFATSSEVAAVVDCDDHGFKLAGGRTLHELLSLDWKRLVGSRRSVAPIVASAHWPWLGQRSGQPWLARSNRPGMQIFWGACGTLGWGMILPLLGFGVWRFPHGVRPRFGLWPSCSFIVTSCYPPAHHSTHSHPYAYPQSQSLSFSSPRS